MKLLLDTLSITVAHASAVAALPLHHRDPFDRLLIAQVQFEGIPIVSVDAAFDAYSIVRLW
ncbi:MAG: PIN domain-containing protein [Ktedonobacterales bacterium]